jgi:hypothetical protein
LNRQLDAAHLPVVNLEKKSDTALDGGDEE